MKNIGLILIIIITIWSCKTTKDNTTNLDEKPQAQVGDTIKISSDKLEYDIIIIEPGFNTFLAARAQPKNYYSQNYLEIKNHRYVVEWNIRVQSPQRFNPNLYEMQINYEPNINYGYDVNYKLYNYFIFFQNQYKQNLLGGVVPTN